MQKISKLKNSNIFLILFIIGVSTYLSVFFNGFVGDDKEQIYNYALVDNIFEIQKVFFYHHAVLGHENTLLGAYYKPLMLVYFYSIRSFFGIDPFFYHTPQVFLCILNSYLLFLFLKKFLLKEVSFFISIIFLIHPINQESVAYVSNIQDVLSFLFGILALLFIGKNKKVYFSPLFIFLSLLSKESGVLFLIFSFLYILIFNKKLFKKYFFLYCLTIISYFILRFFSKGTSIFWIEESSMAQINLIERLKNTPLISSYYLKTFLFPNLLTFNQQWDVKKIEVKNFYAPFLFDLFFVSIISVSNYLLIVNKNKYFKNFLFFSLWLFIGILPYLQLLPLDATVADRWFYVPIVGILGILGVIIQIILNKFKKHSLIILNILIVVCIFLFIRTFIRNADWQNALKLYSHDTVYAKSALIENNLGDEYFKNGKINEAKKHFQNAIKLNRKTWIAYNNLGIIEEKKKNYKSALYYYEKALEIADRLPTYENIARVYILSKNTSEGVEFTKYALRKYPLSATLWLTLSLGYYDLKNYEKALKYAKKSYELLPQEKTINLINNIPK